MKIVPVSQFFIYKTKCEKKTHIFNVFPLIKVFCNKFMGMGYLSAFGKKVIFLRWESGNWDNKWKGGVLS